jgi:ATP-dependent DNA helicase RecG
MLTLDTDIIKISRVGATTAKRLKKLGLETVRDLLFYFPFRYDDFSKVALIRDLKPGESANIVGRIELIQNKRSPRKRMYITEALVSDESESIKIIWFNQPFITRNLRVGDTVSLAGKVEDDYGSFMMKSPAYEKVFNKSPQPPFTKGGNNEESPNLLYQGGIMEAVHTQGLVPNYHLTSNITQKQVRFLIKQVVGSAAKIKDWLPEETRKNAKLLSLGEAVKKIHFPKNQKDIDAAKKRLAFNELFLIQLQSQLIRGEVARSVAVPVPFLEKETKKFVDSLPFKLTDAQRKAAWEILRDLEKDKPMARLLEGDVGSGKTVVACVAMLNAALNGYQAVLMVPTEILARQHYEGICKLFEGWDIVVGLLTRSQFSIFNFQFSNKFQNLKSKKGVLNYIKNGEVKIIIGTHALIQENVEFKNLALAIIDEQHRFGVEQRAALTRTGAYSPHLLSMTATPIPRSLALALYGDLDLSIINEMPKGRKKIITQVVPEEKRGKAYEFIRGQIRAGRQVFVICPLIDISDKLGVKSVKEEFEKLDKVVFKDLNIGMLHGKMRPKEKEEIMRDFLDNKIKILVSTSVVEVGVDAPNATIMMIEGADRFGLAQLHQFRGRVGRGEHQSYCFLFTDSDSPKTLNRLRALVKSNDGFALAKMDLKFRGPGEVYGTMQKGFPELKIASLFDYELMKLAKEEAEKLIKQDASLEDWPELKDKVGEWKKKVHLE